MSFPTSSQARQWTFTPQALDERRRKSYERGKLKVGSNMGYEEYLRYIDHFAAECIKLGHKYGFNRYQRATALAFYQRVYVKRSIWHIPPPVLAILTNFFVSKFLRPNDFQSFLVKCDISEDLVAKYQLKENLHKIEANMLTALDFKLKIHLPFTALVALTEAGFTDEQRADAVTAVCDILMTDALLLNAPAMLAYAAVAKVIGVDDTMNLVPGLDIRRQIEDILALRFDPMSDEEAAMYESTLFEEYEAYQAAIEAEENNANLNAAKILSPP